MSTTQTTFGLDLVGAAQNLHDFLRLLLNHNELFDRKVLREAVRRYTLFWLPLAASCQTHRATVTWPLPAPLDVHLVWIVHMLSPDSYRKTCLDLVGEFLDHVPLSLEDREQLLPLSRLYWENMYPSEPFNISTVDRPVLKDRAVELDNFLAEKSFMYRSVFYQSSLPHFRDEKFLLSAVHRYQLLLELMADNQDSVCLPCCDSDFVWHAHLANPSVYYSDMMRMFGFPVNHAQCMERITTLDNSGNIVKQNRNMWHLKGEPFSVAGAMYRGCPVMTRHQTPLSALKLYMNYVYSFKLDCVQLCNLPIRKLHVCICHVQADGREVKTMETSVQPSGGSWEYVLDESQGCFSYSTGQDGRLHLKVDIRDMTKSSAVKLLPVSRGEVTLVPPSETRSKLLSLEASCTVSHLVNHTVDCLIRLVILKVVPKCYSFAFHSSVSLDDRNLYVCQDGRTLLAQHLPANSSIHPESWECSAAEHYLTPHHGEIVPPPQSLPLNAQSVFMCRTLYSRDPPLTVVEIKDLGGAVLSSAVSISSESLPGVDQLSRPNNACTYMFGQEKALLIRGQSGDWGILKGYWEGFVAGKHNLLHRGGQLTLAFFSLSERTYGKLPVVLVLPDVFKLMLSDDDDDEHVLVNLSTGVIEISSGTADFAEALCLGYAVAVLFVLVEPRPPPEYDTSTGKVRVMSCASRSRMRASDNTYYEPSSLRLPFLAGMGCNLLPRLYRELPQVVVPSNASTLRQRLSSFVCPVQADGVRPASTSVDWTSVQATEELDGHHSDPSLHSCSSDEGICMKDPGLKQDA